jgi:hypothetical protein
MTEKGVYGQSLIIVEIWLLKFDLWQYGLFVAALGIGYETQIS